MQLHEKANEREGKDSSYIQTPMDTDEQEGKKSQELPK